MNAEDSKFGNMKNEYPLIVEECLATWVDALADPEFLDEQDVHPAYVEPATRNVFAPILLDIWLKTGEAVIEGEELAENLIKKFIIEAQLLELKDLGYIDSIEDEHGEEIFWATKEGKEYRDKEMKKK